MSLHEDIQSQLKDALRARDDVRLRTIRGMLAAFTNEAVATGKTPKELLSDEEALGVIKRLAKQHKDSIEQFRSGGRDDLVKNEMAELKVLEAYLPKMMGQKEIEPIVKAKIDELGITEKSQTGKLMGSLMKELQGKADGTDVKVVIERLLT